MAAVALLVLFTLAVAVPAFVAALVLWLTGRRSPAEGGGAARLARRHDLLVTTAATVAAAVCAVAILSQPVTWSAEWVPTPTAPGLLQAIAPFAVALTFCAVRAVGEMTWPRPRGAVRSAPLTRRTTWSLGGVRLRWLVATAVVLVVVLVTCGVVADESGRALAHPPVTLASGAVVEGTSGPFPGWPYGAPLLAGLVAVALAAADTLRLITRRAPLADVPPAHDDAIRSTSAARLLGGVQLCTGGALSLVLLVAGSAVMTIGQPIVTTEGVFPVAGHQPLGVTLLALGAIVGIASSVAGLLAVVPRRPDPETRVPHPRRFPTGSAPA